MQNTKLQGTKKWLFLRTQQSRVHLKSKGVNTESKIIQEAKIYKEIYDHGHDKIHDKPDKSDQLE